MVTALLHLQIGGAPAFGPPPYPRNARPGGRLSGGSPACGGGKGGGIRGQIALRQKLLAITKNAVDLGQCGVALGSDLGGTTGNEDHRLGIMSAGTAYRLTGLALGLGGYGAGVDDDRVTKPCSCCCLRNQLGFECIQPAAEGDDPCLRHDCDQLPAMSSPSKAPSKLSATGPVMITCPSSRQVMSSIPPSSSTAECRPVSPLRCAA